MATCGSWAPSWEAVAGTFGRCPGRLIRPDTSLGGLGIGSRGGGRWTLALRRIQGNLRVHISPTSEKDAEKPDPGTQGGTDEG